MYPTALQYTERQKEEKEMGHREEDMLTEDMDELETLVIKL